MVATRPRAACLIAAIILVTDARPAPAQAPSFAAAERDRLTTYARDTWRSFDVLIMPSGLPADGAKRLSTGWEAVGFTSPTDIAAYLWSTLAAEDLRLIGPEESKARLDATLKAIDGLERSHGFFFNWYDPRTGQRLKAWPAGGGAVRPFLSTVDNGWLAAALMMVANARPEHKLAAEAALAPMDFAFFYDNFDPADPARHPGLLHGGYWADADSYAGFHYGTLNTEPRIASYVGIARGQIPKDHYYRMTRAAGPGPVQVLGGVPVSQGTVSYRAFNLVPSWDGTMFEALMVPLFVPEAAWAPQSWGLNHPLYARAQIEHGLSDAGHGYWGRSASADPAGGYRAFGVPPLGAGSRTRGAVGGSDAAVTPHASFLALAFAPAESMANLAKLAETFPGAYGPYGFQDAVDVKSGQVSDQILVLDQGMILAALANALADGSMHRAFSDGPIADAIRPLIAPEQFASGMIAPAPVAVAALPAMPSGALEATSAKVKPE